MLEATDDDSRDEDELVFDEDTLTDDKLDLEELTAEALLLDELTGIRLHKVPLICGRSALLPFFAT